MTLGLILDIVLGGILLIIAIANCCKGFFKWGIKNLLFLIGVAVIIFVAPILVKLLCKIGFIQDLAVTVNNSLSAIKFISNAGATLIIVGLFVIVVVVLWIALHLLFIPIKKLAKKIQEKEKGFGKFIDKFLGLIFALALWGAIFFFVIAILRTANIVAVNNVIDGSYIYQYVINPYIQPLVDKFINLSALLKM